MIIAEGKTVTDQTGWQFLVRTPLGVFLPRECISAVLLVVSASLMLSCVEGAIKVFLTLSPRLICCAEEKTGGSICFCTVCFVSDFGRGKNVFSESCCLTVLVLV